MSETTHLNGRSAGPVGVPTPRPGDPDPGQDRDQSPAVSGRSGEQTVPGTVRGPGEDQSGDGSPLLVDPPVDQSGDGLLSALAARRQNRRPVVPAWLRSVDQFRCALSWSVDYAGHVTAYHLVRVPWYGLRLAARAPRGLSRVLTRFVGWWFDSAGDAVRLSTVGPNPDQVMYLQLQKHRDARVRSRTIVVGLAALILTVGGVVAWVGLSQTRTSLPAWLGWVALAALVLVLGAAGGQPDRPLAGPAVVPTRVQRLTADLVTRALGALGIAGITQALSRGGSGITFPAPISRDGPGWRAEVDLPFGVTVADVIERRERLASGLRRPLGCVWPEPAADVHAGRLVLWVGDQDMARAKPAPWPLATAGTADIFKPLPFGQDQRGRLVAVLLMFANLLIGAMPRQGKTFALRVLLLACALDARAQMRVFELKGTGDLSALAKVSHHYASGADDDTLRETVASLRDVRAELDRRAKVISGLPRDLCPENKVTPELASRHSLGLFPLVIAIDECQELFAHPTFGAEAEELCLPIIKRGPALGIILILATQRPDKDSLPTGISANMSLRFCLRVMGQVENDMILGTSAYRNGIRATTFTQRDKGIGYLVGNTDDPQIVRSAYIDGPAADRIADRARAVREAAGTLTGHAAGQTPDTGDEARGDLLTDLDAVFAEGEDKAWTATLCARLAELRPEAYGGWTPEQLATALRPHGVRTAQVWGTTPDGRGANRRGITRVDIQNAITQRNQMRGGDGL